VQLPARSGRTDHKASIFPLLFLKRISGRGEFQELAPRGVPADDAGVVPLQLPAHRIARLRGLNVDQPRNLAKTVTVE